MNPTDVLTPIVTRAVPRSQYVSCRASLATPSSSTGPAQASVVEAEVQPELSQSENGFEYGNAIPRLDTDDDGDTGGIPNPQQASTVSAVAPETSPSDNVWSYSVPVPGSRKNKRIYLKAPFEWGPWTQEQWHARFVFVKNELEALVYKELRLLDFENRPSYSPRMVGTCPEDARPSVVVTCRDVDFKEIRNLFHARAEKPLSLGRESTGLQFRPPFGLRTERAEPKIPRLLLVYYRTMIPPVARPALDGPALVSLGSHGAACGSIIRHGGRSATLGVSLDVGDKSGVLTVDHLFLSRQTHEPPSPTETECGSELDDEQFSLAISSGNSLWEDDDEYGDLELDEPPEPTQLQSQAAAPAEDSTSSQNSEEWKTLASSAQLNSSRAAYLDWTLTCPASTTPFPSHLRVNTVFPGGKASEAVVLKTWHESPRMHLAPVYIVSGIRGILHGQMMAVPSFLPSFLGKASSEAWTVMLDDPNYGIISGECGSVVVDRETNGVYGHIVGSGPLAHAYVVSLAHVVDQLKTFFFGGFRTPTLTLPENFRYGPQNTDEQDTNEQHPSITGLDINPDEIQQFLRGYRSPTPGQPSSYSSPAPVEPRWYVPVTRSRVLLTEEEDSVYSDDQDTEEHDLSITASDRPASLMEEDIYLSQAPVVYDRASSVGSCPMRRHSTFSSATKDSDGSIEVGIATHRLEADPRGWAWNHETGTFYRTSEVGQASSQATVRVVPNPRGGRSVVVVNHCQPNPSMDEPRSSDRTTYRRNRTGGVE